MISYLLEFSANGRHLTVYKTEGGSYIVRRAIGEDKLVLANCAEFPDALAVFNAHVFELTDTVRKLEHGV